jgi:aspartyl-tRNA(Asn)/glutamyl-tRNA(Gln) amidotransferase subunit A
VAQKVEPDAVVDSKEKAGHLSWLLTTTYILANVPALSLPCGFATTPGGAELPIGLQIAARPFHETLVLQVAHAYEQQTSWHRKRPALVGE